MPETACPSCGRGIALHELETRAVPTRDALETTDRCPDCGHDFLDPGTPF